MNYVVAGPCIKCKCMDRVEVRAVNCFYEGGDLLVTHPDECIECGVCETEGTVGAVKNAKFAREWLNILTLGAPPRNAAAWDSIVGQITRTFQRPARE